MTTERRVPDDPLGFIRGRVKVGKLLWTYHVNMRLRGRSLSRDVILDSVDSYEIIEAYPEDKYLPSYLVYAHHAGEVIHILFAVDLAGDNVRVLTAYRPDAQQWEPDLRTRRSP